MLRVLYGKSLLAQWTENSPPTDVSSVYLMQPLMLFSCLLQEAFLQENLVPILRSMIMNAVGIICCTLLSFCPLLSSCFIAQLVRALHRNCKLSVSKPVEVLAFSGFSRQLQKNCVHNCKGYSLLELSLAIFWYYV